MLPRGAHGDRYPEVGGGPVSGNGGGGGGGGGDGANLVDLRHIVKPVDERDGILKLIDFGKSCIVLNGKTYSVDDEACESYDLLILIASLLNHGMLKPLERQFRELMEGQTAPPRYPIKNLYDILQSASGAAKLPPFHMTYKTFYMDRPTSIWRNPDDSLLRWFTSEIYEKNLTPAKFAEYWDRYVKAPPCVGGGCGVQGGGLRKRRMGRTLAKRRFQRKKSQRGTRKYRTRKYKNRH
jgi:hypothetical protein